MVLALTLVAGLSTPFLMLPHARAATASTCSENNHNGCTELSPTPPQDTVAVPPNIVLMLDDSGSMSWNFMPDICYLNGVTCDRRQDTTSINNDALIDASNNGVYYDPTVTYLPPPKADSTTAAPDTYPSQTDMTNVLEDGFGVRTTNSVNLFTYTGNYDYNECGGGVCNGSDIDYNASNTVSVPTTKQYDQTVNAVYSQQCVSGSPTRSQTGCNYNHNGRNSGHLANVLTEAADAVCTDTFNSNNGIAGTLVFTGKDKDGSGNWTDGECKFSYTGTTTVTYNFFQYSTGNAAGPYTVYYIAANASDCAYHPTPTGTYGGCVGASDTSGASAPAGVTVATNVANWFAYYHTRILMAKSGLMSAFLNLSADYRFGFGSINGNNDSDLPSPTGNYGQNSNEIAQVQPFGDGTSGTQKAKFWTWIADETANNSTPLRRSLQAVGAYYSSTDKTSPSGNAWDTMSSDPGYTTGSSTQYACRAAYAILTTDGFWNGNDPTTPSGIVGAASKDGPVQTVPSGDVTQYKAVDPFQGGGTSGGAASLADVATYYWENDLNSTLANEVAPSTADPAAWQHMTTFTMGLGFDPTGISPSGTTIPQIFAWAQGGSAISGFSWATPSSNTINNISDLAHAAVNGHGDFFSAKSPQDLAAGFSSAIAQISARNVAPTTAAVNASVVTAGALSFSTGYNTGDWSGSFWAVTINSDGTVNSDAAWKAETSLNSSYHTATGTTNYSTRKVYTDAYTLTTDATGAVTSATFNDGLQFTSANAASLDSVQTAGLESPALAGGNDTLAHRINFLLGDPTYEGTVYRSRTSLLGAIIRSQPVYVSYAASGYYDNWPSGAPEIADGAQSYDTFVDNESTRAGTAYVGANDGMLHAFAAPAPTCTSPTSCTYGNGGTELWAFIPRAVYANLGNLTATSFSYRPTVDETPVTRDVFFSETVGGTAHSEWHTILTGGVGLGGRGVYALDVTDPTSFSGSNVLWEFDSDMTIPSGGSDDCVSIMGSSADSIGCRATDLGYTVSQPNIGRLHDGKWAVLVSNGYFPDCSTADTPTNDSTNCKAIAAQAPKDASGNPYSALFVLDAQTGSVIAELKTPTDITGVSSFGLATPVMGDYDNDQVDDVAFAGDVQGNLWRFDMADASPANWTVTLVYQGIADASGNQGLQPITTMPRLFPDPATNRFMVVFGTGKFLGIGDNSDNTEQAVMGVRDVSGKTYTQSDLTQQYLHETTVSTTLPDGSPNPDPNAGATLRCVTGKSTDTCSSSASAANPIPSSGTGSGGWLVDLYAASGGTQTDAGERVVVSPGAIFASNTVVFETLITGSSSSDPCSPSTQGAIMVLDAGTGGAAGVSSLGGWPYVGGRISNARTSGSLPIVSSLGGGQAYLPGTTLAPSGKTPLAIDAPIWRRRSWNEIDQN